MSYDPGIDVVVVNHRTPLDLDRFLASLVRHPPTAPSSVSVVNVAPTAADIEAGEGWVDRHGHDHDGARHYWFEDNVGYGRACNAGAAAGAREVIALFNADVRLTAGALDRCRAALMARDDWAVLGPRQVDDVGRHTHAGIFGTLAKPEMRGWHKVGASRFCDVRDDAVSVSGAAYFVKRQVWDEMWACPIFAACAPGADGAMLPTPLYFEESALSWHCHGHGYKVAYFGEVCVVHTQGASVTANGLERWAKKQYKVSQEQFRAFCDAHGLAHD